jgi:hypothetical protein
MCSSSALTQLAGMYRQLREVAPFLGQPGSGVKVDSMGFCQAALRRV